MIVFPDSLTRARRGPGLAENFKTLAKFVDKLVKGGNASAIPIEQVSRILLTLNMRVAKSFGLTVPPAILVRADRVIE